MVAKAKKRVQLAQEILKSVAVRVTLVVIISSGLSYFHIQGIIRDGIAQTLDKYSIERSHSEKFLFELAIKNQEILKEEVRKRLAWPVTAEELALFDDRVAVWSDGTSRNRKESFDGASMASVFIPANVVVTDDVKHRMAILIEVAESYGRAFRSHFQNTYFIGSDNSLVVFWPEVPNFAVDLNAGYKLTEDEYFWVADKAHNPSRKTAWTALYYDKNAKIWMASAETPIDDPAGQHALTIGHDIMLFDMIKRTADEHLPGTYNLIFRKDGRLVVHPHKTAALQAADGVYHIEQNNDDYLKGIFHAVIEKNASHGVIEHGASGDLLGFQQISGPEWFFVTVYPKSLVQSTALNAVGFVLCLGLLSLALELLLLYRILQRDVHAPIQDLSAAAETIRIGNFDAPVTFHRRDELGEFADTFRAMSLAIAERDHQLKQHAEDLERIVEERTRQLDIQRAFAVQNAKLASLGEMAGGIAHEVNNPLTIIKGNASLLRRAVAAATLDQQKISGYVDAIDSTIDRIYSIIKGLLAFARIGDHDPFEPIRVYDLVHEALSLAGSKLRDRQVTVKIPPDRNVDESIQGRRVELCQVVLNLISNAADAIGALPAPRWIEIQTRSLSGRNVEIRIIDSGTALRQEDVEKIFQPFFTTKGVGKGTGIGLSISRGITEQHGGTITVDLSGGTTCFVLTLPKEQTMSQAA